MEHFTPGPSFGGGLLIGLSAVILMSLNGRIAGVSGIAAGLLAWPVAGRDAAWRLAFVAGIILAPLLLKIAGAGEAPVTFVASTGLMAVAGVLVGFGTVLGNGCTSGHGVCGIARLSTRSLIATAVFMAAGAATVFISRYVFGA